MSNPIAPWHMWGTSETLRTVTTSGNPIVTGHQLARVDYKRPENWRFLFGGRLLGGDAAVVGPTDVYIAFDLIVGVGRSNFTTEEPFTTISNLRAFCVMHWIVDPGIVPGQQPDNVKIATEVFATPLDDANPGVTFLRVVDHIPAEAISARAKLITAGDPGLNIEAEATAFFAPNAHVRPDWFADENQFRGMETGGT